MESESIKLLKQQATIINQSGEIRSFLFANCLFYSATTHRSSCGECTQYMNEIFSVGKYQAKAS